MKYNYETLTPVQRAALPESMAAKAHKGQSQIAHGNLVKTGFKLPIDFDSVSHWIPTTFEIGLENYGSCRAAWMLPRILKMNGNANKAAQVWHLVIQEVFGAGYTAQQINAAWNGYLPEQQRHISKACSEYLDRVLHYLQTEF